MKRRTIGPAYERSPAEKLGEWISENTLRLIASLIVAVLFCLLVNWLVEGFFNFLATDGKDDVAKPFTTDHPVVDTVKVVGSLLLVFFICRNRAR